jgi:hypothetical protein
MQLDLVLDEVYADKKMHTMKYIKGKMHVIGRAERDKETAYTVRT